MKRVGGVDWAGRAWSEGVLEVAAGGRVGEEDAGRQVGRQGKGCDGIGIYLSLSLHLCPHMRVQSLRP